MIRTVVVYCLTIYSVVARFLLRAQDHNMTNGDFAFFTFQPTTGKGGVQRPWKDADYNLGVEDLPRYRRALYVVKWVSAYFIHFTKPNQTQPVTFAT